MIGTSTNPNLNTPFDLQKCPASHYRVNRIVKYTKVDTRSNPYTGHTATMLKIRSALTSEEFNSHMYNILEGSKYRTSQNVRDQSFSRISRMEHIREYYYSRTFMFAHTRYIHIFVYALL